VDCYGAFKKQGFVRGFRLAIERSSSWESDCGPAHDLVVIAIGKFVALSMSTVFGFRVTLGIFSRWVRELLSLAHCAACGANGEAGPKGECRRRESRK
jgi:hypothetical protein